jgi:hypothetical protein
MVLAVQQILDEARADPHYLGNANFATRSVWIPASDGQSEVLVPTTGEGEAPTGDTEPTVLSMLAQIRGGTCFLTPDGHYHPERPTSWQVGRLVLIVAFRMLIS